MRKRGPRSGFENTWPFDRFLMLKWEAWNDKKEVFALYVLQITRSKNGCQKPSKMVPKSFKNHEKYDLGRFRRRLGRKVVSGMVAGRRTVNSLVPFWHRFGDIGGHFDTHRILKGSPKRPLVNTNLKKWEKGGPRNGFENTCLFYRSLITKWEA